MSELISRLIVTGMSGVKGFLTRAVVTRVGSFNYRHTTINSAGGYQRSTEKVDRLYNVKVGLVRTGLREQV